jgi:myo-inositol-1(or 4)-monophosphatase
MDITSDFLHEANHVIHKVLMELRPKLLEMQGKVEHTLKDDNSVVTKMDVMVEERLRDVLAEFAPSIGFCGEETGVDLTQKTFWLVDPIDGTEAFVRGLPFCTNMVALIHDGQAVLGIIYNFVLDEYYLAVKGQGATCNGHAIHVSTRPLDRAFVVITSDMRPIGLPGDAPLLLKDYVLGQPKVHASGFEYISIARGALDGCIVVGRKGVWDHAAGTLLIMEAGGRVANIDSDTYDYKNMHYIAGNPAVFEGLRKFVASHQMPTVS